ncbi:MAG: HD domain-containing protein [Clostridiales bacterium]|nr:HD domain-containing protein [Clostridiales bacterium]
MSQPKLSELAKGEGLDGFLLVRSAAQRMGQNGKAYLDMTLADATGDTNAKMWDAAMPAPQTGSVIRVRGVMLDYNGKPQFRVDRMRPSTPEDNFDLSILVPVAPENPQDMLDDILNRVDAIADRELKKLVLHRLEEVGEEIMYYPAAQKLHHAERSGLLHHITGMLRTAERICEVYPFLDADLLASGVILHDLGKITEMRSDEMGIVSEYTAEGLLLGHLVTGVAALSRAGEKLGTRPELILMLQHMIISHHDLPEFGSPRRPMFPEAEVLHILDLLDARMFEMPRELQQAAPGGFTDKIWSLDRRLYRRENPVADDAIPF